MITDITIFLIIHNNIFSYIDAREYDFGYTTNLYLHRFSDDSDAEIYEYCISYVCDWISFHLGFDSGVWDWVQRDFLRRWLRVRVEQEQLLLVELRAGLALEQKVMRVIQVFLLLQFEQD